MISASGVAVAELCAVIGPAIGVVCSDMVPYCLKSYSHHVMRLPEVSRT
jgi:hypothetical protein